MGQKKKKKKARFLAQGLWESERLLTWVSLLGPYPFCQGHRGWESEDGERGSKHLGEVAGPLEVMGYTERSCRVRTTRLYPSLTP